MTFIAIPHTLRYTLRAIAAMLVLALLCPVARAGKRTDNGERRFVVTLDAGHGGHDSGALGKHSREKDITLQMVKKVGALIDKNLSRDVKVVYTRDDDYFVTLENRAKIANDAKSNLFISIHINSVAAGARNRSTVEGTSIYTLGLHKTDDNLAVAKRENAVIELEGNDEMYKAFDPESQESDIIFELTQNKRLDQSIEFAEAVHDQLVSTAGRTPKGVRQAGFWVLWATSMPAVLIELDFICNPTVEDYISSDKGQDEMAAAIYNAFCSYLNTYGPEILSHKVSARQLPADRKSSGNSAVPMPPQKKTKPEQAVPPPPAKDRIKPINDDEGSEKKPAYRIQFTASVRPLNLKSPEIEGVDNPRYYVEDGLYKYTTGPYSNEKKARKELKKMREEYPDAFIIIIKEGKRAGMLK